MSDNPAPIRVLVVDDHSIIRNGLVSILGLEGDIEIVGEAATADDAIAKVAELHPDVVVMDVNLGNSSGMEATRQIRRHHPDIGIIGLSMHVDPDIATAMEEAGATAYLAKGEPPEELIEAVRQART